jgi:hypothetical protein
MQPVFQRVWAMPSASTFTIKPIHDLIMKYRRPRIIDPFARSSNLTEWSNDLNTKTSAKYHMDAVAFLDLMVAEERQFDLALLDPPYSPRQISECYQDAGRKVSQTDTQIGPMYNAVKDRIDKLLVYEGTVISFGWNSIGMGSNRCYDVIEILLVCHGGLHNDTICTVEQKRVLPAWIAWQDAS